MFNDVTMNALYEKCYLLSRGGVVSIMDSDNSVEITKQKYFYFNYYTESWSIYW